MGVKEDPIKSDGDATKCDDVNSNVNTQTLNTIHTPTSSLDKDTDFFLCRVCQCSESEKRGDSALTLLNISPPSHEYTKVDAPANSYKEQGFVEFISPEGEVFVCCSDLESGSSYQQDALINLGCSCKNELALAHYACALKWFISHGSTNCEICGSAAKNVRTSDVKKVMSSLKEYDTLSERTATGELNCVRIETIVGVDPDALAARRQRLCEVLLWFNPHNSSTAVSQESVDQLPNNNNHTENIAIVENPTAKWAVEGTGVLVATGLLTVILACLIAPHVGKKTARSGFHILLGGVCALTVVIFLRFVILSKIKYGPARYWAILFVFWFLVFGIWASRTH